MSKRRGRGQKHNKTEAANDTTQLYESVIAYHINIYMCIIILKQR